LRWNPRPIISSTTNLGIARLLSERTAGLRSLARRRHDAAPADPMASVTAKRQCPDLIFVKPRFEVYKAISPQIRDI
jgi:nucleotidyltransferase/DNA polymerase involved in DNA repair